MVQDGDSVTGGAYVGLEVTKAQRHRMGEGGGGVLGILRGAPTVRVGAKLAEAGDGGGHDGIV